MSSGHERARSPASTDETHRRRRSSTRSTGRLLASCSTTRCGSRLRARDVAQARHQDPAGDRGRRLTVGFVDLVGYTALSQELEPDELGALVSRFEELALRHGRRARRAGRQDHRRRGDVRRPSDAAAAARIALRLTERSARRRAASRRTRRSRLRLGASPAKATTTARSSTSPAGWSSSPSPAPCSRPTSCTTRSGDDPAFAWQRLRPRRIRDIGRVEIWALDRVPRSRRRSGSRPGGHRAVRYASLPHALPPATTRRYPFCLLAVHAHPDDEASKGAGTVAKYPPRASAACSCAAPAARRATSSTRRSTRPRSGTTSHAVRMAGAAGQRRRDRLRPSLHLLGYHDSGMPDTETNARPDNFANAPLDEAVGDWCDHPGRATAGHRHLRATTASSTRTPTTSGCTRSRARRSTPPAIPIAFPDAGEPWQPSKMYYIGLVDAPGRRRCTRRTSRIGRREPVRALVRERRRFPTTGDRLHDAHRRRRLPRAPRGPRCSRTAPRSTPTASG